MARSREFDEDVVLDAAMEYFWNWGYEATSVRDLIETTGLTGASLYNAFGDKRALFRAALDRYVESSIGERIRRCEALPPREAVARFFEDILQRSLTDRQRKGCMLVNSALEIAAARSRIPEGHRRGVEPRRNLLPQVHRGRPGPGYSSRPPCRRRASRIICWGC